MMHLLRKNDVDPLRSAMMRCLPQTVAKPRIIRRSRHHWALPTSFAAGKHHSKNAPLSVDKSAFFLVEPTGIEPVSKNPLIQLSPWAVCLYYFPRTCAGKQAHAQGSPFMPDRLKCEPPMHVHHCHDVQAAVVVLRGGTGDPQVAALLSFTPRGRKT